MKLLTLNFLTCARKACKQEPSAFPLHPRDAELERVDQEVNPEFLVNVLPRLDWKAIRSLSEEVMPPPKPQNLLARYYPPCQILPKRIEMLTQKGNHSSVSPPSLKPHPNRKIYWMKLRNNLHKHCRICIRCWWKRVSATANWFVGVVGMSMLSKKGLRIFCCLVIWCRGGRERGREKKEGGGRGKKDDGGKGAIRDGIGDEGEKLRGEGDCAGCAS
jgi:hypothetical protein